MPQTTNQPSKKKAARHASGTAAANRRGAVKRTESRSPRVKVGAATKTPAAALRAALQLSRQDFARLSGFSVRKIADLEKGGAAKPSTEQRLAELHRLQQGLARIMKADFAGEWLRTPNSAFGGLKPLEVIERGQVDRLWRMIHLLEAGLPV